jgi:hypothetical protein
MAIGEMHPCTGCGGTFACSCDRSVTFNYVAPVVSPLLAEYEAFRAKCYDEIRRIAGLQPSIIADDQPQPEDYATRRQRIAAERNPGGNRIRWAWPDEPVDERAAGVQRAVRNLSQVEHRIGAAKFQP